MTSIPGPIRRTPAWNQVLSVCPSDIRQKLALLSPEHLAELEEIRLRLGQAVQVVGSRYDCFLSATYGLTHQSGEGLVVTADHLQRVIQAVTQSSLYAVEEDVRRGFVTIPGGHRVGIAGRVVLSEAGTVRAVRLVSSLNIRVAKERIGSAQTILPFTYDTNTGRPLNVLLLSPPQCGKTTLLRDLVRSWSTGRVSPGVAAARVSLIDERSEIAGSMEGQPQFDVGPRTDILDGCPKAEGVLMAIRSLSPGVVVTDEIGHDDDAAALIEATHAGVAVFASAHAHSVGHWRTRPSMKPLYDAHAFERYVVLSRRRGPGTVERICDAHEHSLYSAAAVAKVTGP